MSNHFSDCFCWPIADADVEEKLRDVWTSGNWGRYRGPHYDGLLQDLRSYFNTDFARLCSSGTVAVEIALKAVNVQPGDEVILGGYDFPGNFRCIEAVGGFPVLADIDPASNSLSSQSVQDSISPKTKAVIVSHLHGGIADIQAIVKLARENEIAIVEDICQSPGARHQGNLLGTFGDVATLSFGGSKLLTAGRGGAVLFHTESDYQRAVVYCDRGNDAFPLSELQAAVVRPQLAKLDQRNESRLKSAKMLIQNLSELPSSAGVTTVSIASDDTPAFYKFPICVPVENKQDLINELQAMGIVIDHGFKGFTKRSRRRCRIGSNCSQSARIAEQILVLHHPCMLSPQFEKIADQICDSIRRFCV